jgi:hypothetical protein
MRILSLGFPLPGASIDNHTFANAPTFFDYDAIVVDPLSLSNFIEDIANDREEHTTRSGEPIVNEPTGPGKVGLVDLLRDRQDETARLLANGGLVVVIAYSNVVHAGVAGFAGCDRYFWLPAPAGLQYREPFLRRGAGTNIIPIEHEHAFGPFVDRFRKKLAYQAYLDTGVPAFDGAGRTFARSAGGAAIGVELTVGNGRIVFLPPPAKPPTGEERYAFSNVLQDAIRRTLRLESTAAPPSWLAEYALPGLAERTAAHADATQKLTEAQDSVDEQEGAVDEIERFRGLLWQEGRHGIEEPVRDALAQIGFRVIASDIDAPAWIQLPEDRAAKQAALIEVEASVNAVGMEAHYRLRTRLEAAIAAGTPKRGLLIINGHRTTAPAERPAQYEDALRVAAESMRYCVATTEQLFHAVRASLDGDEATVDAVRQRLLTTEGILQED